jgi:hypothetical protein
MNTEPSATQSAATRPDEHDVRQPQMSGRYDIYRPIHKGLRAFMSETLSSVGRLDADDAAEVEQTLAQVRDLLGICRVHLEMEEQHLHPAMESRHGGSSSRIAADHAGHLEAFDTLASAVRAVEGAHGATRSAAAITLYRRLALFVADNFEHMHAEETDGNAVLWQTHTDEELQAIEQAIGASVPPAHKALGLRWMVPNLAPQERALLLTKFKRGMPPEAFTAAMASLKPHLDQKNWNKLLADLAGL